MIYAYVFTLTFASHRFAQISIGFTGPRHSMLHHISNSAYHADTSRISKSGLDLIHKSPSHYWERYLNPDREPDKKSPAFLLGSAVHTLTLEPSRFADDILIVDSLKSVGSTYMQAENPDKTVIDKDMFELARLMSLAVRRHPTASALLDTGIAEATLYFDDPETCAPCKIRPDWLNQELEFIVELKTAEDASAEGFARDAARYRYHVQGAFFKDGLYQSEGLLYQHIFIVVEKSPPFRVAMYMLPQEELDLGRRAYNRDLIRYTECRKTGKWPGYPEEIVPLKLPRWAFYQEGVNP